jgi:DNA-binding LacI/PurR family transcriptional regulator
VTIDDVARESGVSVATVSRAMRGLPNVSPVTRQRVLDVASELRYRPDPNASRLAAGKTGVVAMAVPSITSWYTGQAMAGVEAVLAAAGFELSVTLLSDGATRERVLAEPVLAGETRSDALILLDLAPVAGAADPGSSFPVVVVGDLLPESVDSVSIDNVVGGELAGSASDRARAPTDRVIAGSVHEVATRRDGPANQRLRGSLALSGEVRCRTRSGPCRLRELLGAGRVRGDGTDLLVGPPRACRPRSLRLSDDMAMGAMRAVLRGRPFGARTTCRWWASTITSWLSPQGLTTVAQDPADLGAKGAQMLVDGSDDFESQLRIRVDGGDPPAVAFTPQPGSICEFADEGALVSLEEMGFDIAEMEANHSKFWMDLGLCDDGQHYGIPWFPNFKSIVFYHAPTFEANGYEIPETWEDMLALSQQIVDDGMTPWCFGFGSGGATGWPGTDWIEDILVRQAGGEIYAQWFNHEIPFNHPAVLEAFETFGELFFADGFVLGGPENVPDVAFQDSPGPLFQDPPGCLMLKQGSFISNFFVEQPDYEPGDEDRSGCSRSRPSTATPAPWVAVTPSSSSTAAPEIVQVIRTGSPRTGSAPWPRPVAAAIAPYGGHGVDGVERLPGHKDVDPNCYETDSAKSFAESVTEALARTRSCSTPRT